MGFQIEFYLVLVEAVLEGIFCSSATTDKLDDIENDLLLPVDKMSYQHAR